VNIDECEPQPCLHGSTCIDQIAAFLCDCTDTGYQGPHCETEVDDCEPQPCRHNATCEDLLKDYKCHCYDGYDGHDCEIDIDECADFPCQNGAMCYQKSNPSIYIPVSGE